jgi:Membrane fusion protein Use1
MKVKRRRGRVEIDFERLLTRCGRLTERPETLKEGTNERILFREYLRALSVLLETLRRCTERKHANHDQNASENDNIDARQLLSTDGSGLAANDATWLQCAYGSRKRGIPPAKEELDEYARRLAFFQLLERSPHDQVDAPLVVRGSVASAQSTAEVETRLAHFSQRHGDLKHALMHDDDSDDDDNESDDDVEQVIRQRRRGRGGVVLEGGDASRSTATTIDALIDSERREHDTIAQDLLTMTSTFKEYAQRSYQVIEADVSQLRELELRVSLNADALGQTNSSAQRQINSSWSSTLTLIALIVIVLVVFIFTFILIRLFPSKR